MNLSWPRSQLLRIGIVAAFGVLISAADPRMAGAAAPVPEVSIVKPSTVVQAVGRADLGSARRGAVISGGVSLGGYQAGFLEYYSRYLEWLAAEASRERATGTTETWADMPMSLYAGASAGSINALLLALRQCYKPTDTIEDELFFKLWQSASLLTMLKQTLEKGRHTPEEANALVGQVGMDSLMQVIAAELGEKKPEKGDWRECKVGFGATVTRMSPRQLSINEALDDKLGAVVPRMTEKFMVRIDYGAPDRSLTISPFAFSDAHLKAAPDMFPLLAMPEKGSERSFDELLKLAQGSAAIPLVFPPAAIPHNFYMPNPDPAGKPPFLKTLIETGVHFVDGGILNNNPIDLIWYMRLHDRDPSAVGVKPLENVHILYLDQDITGAQSLDTPESGVNKGVLSTYGAVVGNLLNAGTTSQLVSILELAPELRAHTEAPIRSRLLAGQYAFSLSSLFDSSFMVYDYYQGMIAAREWLAARTEALTQQHAGDPSGGPRSQLVEQTLLHRWKVTPRSEAPSPRTVVDAVDSTFHSPRFNCFKDVFAQSQREHPETVASCQDLLTLRNREGTVLTPRGGVFPWEKRLLVMPDLPALDIAELKRVRTNHNLLALLRTLKDLEVKYQGRQPPDFFVLMKALQEDEKNITAQPASPANNGPQKETVSLPFRTLEVKGTESSLFPDQPLAPQYVIRALRWYTDIALESAVALQPGWVDKVLLETVGDQFLNGYLGRLPDRRHLDLGLSTEGIELRAVDSIFNRRRIRGHLGLNVLTPKVFPDDAEPDSTQYGYRADLGVALGLTYLPLLNGLPLGGHVGLMDFSALALSARLVGRTEVLTVDSGSIKPLKCMDKGCLYPQLELSLILLDRIEPFMRMRFSGVGDGCDIPSFWVTSGFGPQDLSWGAMVHF